ncbi:sigma-70 family RNA polymerase sigma factor [Aquiluna sp.]|nr:sigma-70 family RNA polymerase sigma factor [Aquiluna sp.]
MYSGENSSKQGLEGANIYLDPIEPEDSESSDQVASTSGASLSDWSAQDFANVYVRFRPHLMSQARRILHDEIKAEEVVQDAFLYLMTALPELDSELGVLRFLRWKTKMLCFDVIRASKSGLQGNLVPLPDDFAAEVDISETLEKADDVAIINLALAKLSPRHREALIATTYEEKSAGEVARQMGLEENAFRQLLYRARKSFRIALVGEASVEGKSAAEILSLAAKRAGSKLTVPALALLVAGLAFPLMPSQELANDSPGLRVSSPWNGFNLPTDVDRRDEPSEGAKGNFESLSDSSVLEGSAVAEDSAAAAASGVEVVSRKQLVVSDGASQFTMLSPGDGDPLSTSLEDFNEYLGADMISQIVNKDFGFQVSPEQVLTIVNPSGLKVNLAFDIESENVVQYLTMQYEADGNFWMAVPGNSLSVVEKTGDTWAVSYAATDFLVGDFSGQYDFVATQDSAFSRSGIKIDLLLSRSGQVIDASASFMPKQ